jgi:hypothetical protein
VTCPRCGGTTFISNQDLTGSSTGVDSDLVMCETCEFVWAIVNRKRKKHWPGGHRQRKRSK